MSDECPHAVVCASGERCDLEARMATMLRKLEWAGGYTDDCDSLIACCPACGEDAPDEPGSAGNHSPTCDLAQLLKDLP